MPGIVAMRMPRRVASCRASVWLNENVVGAKITVASAIAEQISNGGSSPWRVPLSNATTRTLRAREPAASLSASAIASCGSLHTMSTTSSGPTPRQSTAASAERITRKTVAIRWKVREFRRRLRLRQRDLGGSGGQRERPAEQIALPELDPERGQRLPLVLALDALRDDLQLEP